MRRKIPGLWERIQEAFGGAGVPQIAQLLGLSKPSVYQWRKGDAPWLDTLVHISELTNTSLHWLLTGEGPRSRQLIKDLNTQIGEEHGAYTSVAEAVLVRKYLARQLAELTQKGNHDEIAQYLIGLLAQVEKTLHKGG